uniref:Uncharacterized protein n=1 Tax=Anopheles culicifacies TaxID=139723 RepID=A0A182MET1_9DIPT
MTPFACAVDNVEEQVTKSATSSSKTTSSATSENHSYQHQESYIEQVSSVSKSKQYIQQTASEEFLVRERLVKGKHDSVSTLNSVQQLSTTTTSNGNGTTEHDNRLNGTAQSTNRFHVFKLDRLNIPQTGGPVTDGADQEHVPVSVGVRDAFRSTGRKVTILHTLNNDRTNDHLSGSLYPPFEQIVSSQKATGNFNGDAWPLSKRLIISFVSFAWSVTNDGYRDASRQL